MFPEPAIKVVGGLLFSSAIAFIESLEVFEGALQRIGLPLLCVAGFAYAVVILSKKYKESSDGRIEDAKKTAEVLAAMVEARLVDAQTYSEKLERHVENGAESREKLIVISEKSLALNAEQLKAQAKMAIALDNLTAEMRRCQETHNRQ